MLVTRHHRKAEARRVHPGQLLLSGLTLAEVGAHPWLEGVDLPATVAELAVAWFACRPPPWKLGSYPVGHIQAARDRVRRLEREGWVRVEAGPLRHRRQVGVVVRGVR